MLVELYVLVFALIWGHVQCLINSFGHSTKIPRVDVDSVRQCTCGTREFRKNQGAVVGLLADDIFQTGCVHAVSYRGDQSDISHAQESKILARRQVLWVVLDGREAQRAKSAINGRNQVGNLASNLVVGVLLLLF